ncbi:MAG: hypothetical protein HYU64_00850 [Armatimonadetes bacterium]|nr:hypothetical protein [Armatimonadota bacterium]
MEKFASEATTIGILRHFIVIQNLMSSAVDGAGQTEALMLEEYIRMQKNLLNRLLLSIRLGKNIDYQKICEELPNELSEQIRSRLYRAFSQPELRQVRKSTGSAERVMVHFQKLLTGEEWESLEKMLTGFPAKGLAHHLLLALCLVGTRVVDPLDEEAARTLGQSLDEFIRTETHYVEELLVKEQNGEEIDVVSMPSSEQELALQNLSKALRSYIQVCEEK